MAVIREFWRLFETAVLAFPLHHLIVWPFFVLRHYTPATTPRHYTPPLDLRDVVIIRET